MSENLPSTDARLTRRTLLGAGLALGALALTGCASSSSRVARRSARNLPDPRWPDLPRTDPSVWDRPDPRPRAQAPSTAAPGVHNRTNWAGGTPIPARMDRMQPIRRITVHHDGMPPAAIRSANEAAERIELIRRAHLSRGWGDIGYHCVVDPLGGVWEARPLSWQGAHVRAQNEGNLGVLVLGNFERQRPTPAQLSALDRFVAGRMGAYRVPIARVHTHRELAPTACPGRFLQAYMQRTRGAGGQLASLASGSTAYG